MDTQIKWKWPHKLTEILAAQLFGRQPTCPSVISRFERRPIGSVSEAYVLPNPMTLQMGGINVAVLGRTSQEEMER